MMNAHTIVDEIGKDEIAASVGVTPHSVRKARAEGRFPASWYMAIRAKCRAAGLFGTRGVGPEFDRLFAFKGEFHEKAAPLCVADTDPDDLASSVLMLSTAPEGSEIVVDAAVWSQLAARVA